MRILPALLIAGVAGAVLAPRVTASGRPQVLITVDVESNEAFDLPDQIDARCEERAACGLMEIVRELQARGLAGTFFLNVYEHRRWGQTAMRNIALRLQAAGQDVALHTHPQWAYDPARWEMHAYSLDEQRGIVRDGVQMLREWTGRPVVAHRAGAYAADERTLTAVEENGVLVDSSVFWQHPNSRLDGLGLPRNVPGRRGLLTEIPVTVYRSERRPRFVGNMFAPTAYIGKFDVNWVTDKAEADAAVDAVVAADLPFIVVFLHSYSFMKSGTAPGSPGADLHAMEVFRAVLDRVAARNLAVVTMRDIADGKTALPYGRPDVVPTVAMSIDMPRYLWRRLRTTAGLPITVGVGLGLLMARVAIVLARRGVRTR